MAYTRYIILSKSPFLIILERPFFSVHWNYPDDKGKFGRFGGRFVPEVIHPLVAELEKAWADARKDPAFQKELSRLLKDFVGRPTPLYFAENLSNRFGSKILLKREDLCHTGAHKINSAIGQALLAKRMGKKRIIAETGAGQHGVATAAACARLGLKCEVYMGSVDIKRQALNVYRMKLFGAKVHSVESGSKTLKDAVNEAFRDWIANVSDTHYLLGSVVGPHPYPLLVRDLQSVIGKETREQSLNQFGRLPDALVACVGGGSNAAGFFHPFVKDSGVAFWGVEAGGKGEKLGEHSATICKGSPGVLHGSLSYLLQDEYGQVAETHSVSAGLDYPGVGPEHSLFKDSNRANYVSVTDREALEACKLLSETEGIIPALESSHAVSFACQLAQKKKNSTVCVCLSGRGDKDMGVLMEQLKM